MAIAFIAASGAGSVSTGDISAGASQNSTGGNFIVVAIADYNASGPTAMAADSKGNNSWQYLTATTNSPGLMRVRIAYHFNATCGSGHTFSTTGGTAAYPAIGVLTFSGVDSTSACFDATAGEGSGATFSGTTVTATSITPTNDNELMVSACAGNVDTSTTINVSFVSPTSANGGANAGTSFYAGLAYQIQTTKTARGPTMTGADTTNGRCIRTACFIPPASGGGAVTRFLSMLGAGT